MIKDERISETKSRIASRAFGMWYFLLLATLLYRQFYLKQALEDYWDIALIFFLGCFYVVISAFAKGAVYESSIAKSWKWTAPVIIITILGLNYFQGNLNTIAELLVTLISAMIGLAFVGIVFYFLYKRWEKKINLDS